MARTKQCARKTGARRRVVQPASQPVQRSDESDDEIATTPDPDPDTKNDEEDKTQTSTSDDSTTQMKGSDEIQSPTLMTNTDESKSSPSAVEESSLELTPTVPRNMDTSPTTQDNTSTSAPSNNADNLQLTPPAVLPTVLDPNPQYDQLRAKITRIELAITQTQTELTQILDELQEVLASKNSPNSSPSSKPTTAVTSLQDQASDPTIVNSPNQLQLQEQANYILANHIKQLTTYNQVKDVAMHLLGIIADNEGKRVKQVMSERDIADDSD